MPEGRAEGFLISTLRLTHVGDVERAELAELPEGTEVSTGNRRRRRRPVAREGDRVESREVDLLVAGDSPQTVSLGNQRPLAPGVLDERHVVAKESLEQALGPVTRKLSVYRRALRRSMPSSRTRVPAFTTRSSTAF